jgi:hypothetical protein
MADARVNIFFAFHPTFEFLVDNEPGDAYPIWPGVHRSDTVIPCSEHSGLTMVLWGGL